MVTQNQDQRPAVSSVFDVGKWFLDKGLEQKTYVQPRKLQGLLYLAQGYYAALSKGGLFMPALFLADEKGPFEPSSYRIFEQGCPAIFYPPLEDWVNTFLEKIWMKFGLLDADELSARIRKHAPFREALAQGVGTVVALESMASFYRQKTDKISSSLSGGERVKLMRSHRGYAVQVAPWTPKKGDSK